MSGIVWEEPPPKQRGRGPAPIWSARLAPVRERPGVWANVGRWHSRTVTGLRQGHYAEIAAGEYEVEGREFDRTTNLVTLYVRYVGGEDAGASSATSAEAGQ